MKSTAATVASCGDGAYQKPGGLAAHAGAVYAVAGSSGKISGGTLNHPAMVVSLNSLGSMVLDVFDGRLDAVFLDATGVTRDSFTIPKGGAVPQPPSAPTGLTASASGTSITLGWTDHADNEDGFHVERAQGSGSFTVLPTTPGPNASGVIDSGLAAGTTYRYRVQAFNQDGSSAYSNEASATTAAATAVAAPSGLTATARSTTVIDLAWVDNAANETGFEVQRSTTGTSFTTIVTLGPNATTYANTGLSKNKLYYYRVRAVRTGTAPSTYSNTANARTLKR